MQSGTLFRITIPRIFPAILCLLGVISCGTHQTQVPGTAAPSMREVGLQGDHCTSSNTVAAFGDSLTYALTKDGDSWIQARPTWLQTMATDLGGWCSFNGGVPSEGSAQIAVRQGGLRPRLTLEGNQIPAHANEVPVAAVSPSDGWSLDTKAGILTLKGTLAGVAGKLQYTPTGGANTWSYLPDSPPPSAVSVPMESEFLGDQQFGDHDALQIIWAGTNNRVQIDAIERDTATMIASLPPTTRYLVIGTIPETKDVLTATYGQRFVDLRTWLSTHGLAAAGISSPTTEDLEATAAGRIPPSLTVAGGHFTQAGYDAIGHYLAKVVVALGWD